MYRTLSLFTLGLITVTPQITNAAAPALSFYPAAPWSMSDAQTCTLSTQYNNGFKLGIDGKNDQIIEITLDVRQDAFSADASYTATVSFPNSNTFDAIPALMNTQTIALQPNDGTAAYQALQNAEYMDITIDKNAFRFYLSDMDTIKPRFKNCVTPHAPIAQSKTTYTDRGNDKVGLDYMGIQPDDAVTVKRETFQTSADFTDASIEVSRLERENAKLRDELAMTLREGEREINSIQGNNWDLERATLMYNEAERQVQILGQKLKRQEIQHQAEVKELEQMLFDPRVTQEEQLSRLTELEDELAKAQEELQLQRMRYDERIRMLEGRLATQ